MEITKTINKYSDFIVEITAEVFDHEGNHDLLEISITPKGVLENGLSITEMFQDMSEQEIEKFFGIDWGQSYSEYTDDAKEFQTHFLNH